MTPHVEALMLWGAALRDAARRTSRALSKLAPDPEGSPEDARDRREIVDGFAQAAKGEWSKINGLLKEEGK
jgi:hypothetical protein